MKKTLSLNAEHFKVKKDGTNYYLVIVIYSDRAFNVCESIESGKKITSEFKKIIKANRHEVITINKEKLFEEMDRYSFLYNDMCKFYNYKEAKRYTGNPVAFTNFFETLEGKEFTEEE